MKMLSLMLLSTIIYAHAMETMKPFSIIKKKVYATDPLFCEIIKNNKENIDLQKFINEEKGRSYIMVNIVALNKKSNTYTNPLVLHRKNNNRPISPTPIGLNLLFGATMIPTPPPLPVTQQSFSSPS